MTDSEVNQMLRLAYTKACSKLPSQSPEESLLEFIENVNFIWNRAYKLHFFRETEYMTPEDDDTDTTPDLCILCGEIFMSALTEDEWHEVEEDKIRYPMSEPVRICEDCCVKIEARMPHRANLN